MANPKIPTIALRKHEVHTTIFALRHFIKQLREDLKTETREHGPAECAAAIADSELLLERLEDWTR